jgi:hypothetical protein
MFTFKNHEELGSISNRAIADAISQNATAISLVLKHRYSSAGSSSATASVCCGTFTASNCVRSSFDNSAPWVLISSSTLATSTSSLSCSASCKIILPTSCYVSSSSNIESCIQTGGHNVFHTAFKQIWVNSAQALPVFRMAW